MTTNANEVEEMREPSGLSAIVMLVSIMTLQLVPVLVFA